MVCALAAAAACRAAPALAGTHPSATLLAAAVLDALQQRDGTALEGLAVSGREFRDHVWPALPAARPERNLPVDYVWNDLHQKSAHSLGELLVRHGGRRYALIGVDFDGVTDYGSFRVHRQATLRVRDASGAARTLRVCGSMLEKDGSWKVFSFVVDDDGAGDS